MPCKYFTLGYERMLCQECDEDMKPIIAATISFSGNGYYILKRYEKIDGKLERLAYEIDVECNEQVLNRWLESRRIEEVKEDELSKFVVKKMSEFYKEGLPIG